MNILEKENFEFNYFYEEWINDIFSYLQLKKEEHKDLETLLLCLLSSLQKGNLCISLEEDIPENINHDHINTQSLKEKIKLFENHKVFKNLFVIQDSYIYFRKHYQALLTLKEKLKSLKSNTFYKTFDLDLVNKYLSLVRNDLNEEQTLSIILSTIQPFLIISGGPGTGKTRIASHVVGIHLFLGIPPDKIFISAPTGRAASRLKESITQNLKNIIDHNDLDQIKPFTIHRLLKFNPLTNEFFYNQQNFLRFHLLIIDEASMIDIFLMQNLFLAIPELSPNNKIVVLGDKNQLPSVLEGNVLEDLIPKKTFSETGNIENFIKSNYNINLKIHNSYFVNLKTSYRNTKEIKQLADFIIEEESDKIFDYLNSYKTYKNSFLNSQSPIVWIDENNKNVIFQLIIKYLENKIFTKSFLINLEKIQTKSKEEWDHILIEEIYEKIINYKILVPTHLGELGVSSINQMIKENNNSKKILSAFPILITENDYYNQLFNGDIGILLRDKNNNEFVCFKGDTKFYFYSLLSLKKFDYAYTMTIHKSQGSEYKEVFLILPKVTENYKNFIKLLNKKTLYTAITRAKEKLYLISSKETLDFCFKNSLKRISGIDLWDFWE